MQLAKMLLLTLCVAWAACTFPNAEYEQPEPPCAVPASCNNEVSACSNKAKTAQNKCAMKCSMTCLECDADFERDIGICVAQCEACSANAGCMNATESCKALSGAP